MHTVFALLCFVVVIHWLIFPYPSGLLHWHCGNLTIAPVPAKQPWWIWINTSCEFIMNDCITTTKQSTTKPCAYFLGYTVWCHMIWRHWAIMTWSSIWAMNLFRDHIPLNMVCRKFYVCRTHLLVLKISVTVKLRSAGTKWLPFFSRQIQMHSWMKEFKVQMKLNWARFTSV